jgi:hypothetical protein
LRLRSFASPMSLALPIDPRSWISSKHRVVYSLLELRSAGRKYQISEEVAQRQERDDDEVLFEQ